MTISKPMPALAPEMRTIVDGALVWEAIFNGETERGFGKFDIARKEIGGVALERLVLSD